MNVLAEKVLQGERLALARLLTLIENATLEGREALQELFPHTGRAHLIGVTGAPGTGKSTLVNALARHFRQVPNAKKVAVVAVDPSSPFSGGAILGDRVRMRDLMGDEGVFIRSMATRGSLGGLAMHTSGVVQALDAAGYELIFIETVGAGQAEVDVARLAHTTIVIEAPGFGDDIQVIKAGILEIADILVVNKADHPSVEATERALRSMLQLGSRVKQLHDENFSLDQSSGSILPEKGFKGWTPPVIRTIAIEAQGIETLAQAVGEHYQYLLHSGELLQRERNRLRSELHSLVQEKLLSRWQQGISLDDIETMVERLVKRELSPWQAASILLDGNVH